MSDRDSDFIRKLEARGEEGVRQASGKKLLFTNREGHIKE